MATTNDSASDGNTDAVPAGRVLVVDERFAEALSDDELRSYLETVTRAASGVHADVDELSRVLSADLERLNLPMAPVQVKMLAEQLFGAQDARLNIVTTGGKVLAEHDGVAGAPRRAGSAGDPEHPDRPFIS